MNRSRAATFIGLLAIVFWSALVGLIRAVSEALGAIGGAALIYTLASCLLLVTIGPTRLRDLPRSYLAAGGLLFVSYEICLALSIGYASSGRQAIEVGMVNYLWPCVTMVFALMFRIQKFSLLMVPGWMLSILGVVVILGGGHGVNLCGMAASVGDNPLSFGMAVAGTMIWAGYCTLTAKTANGKNGITFFFMLTAAALWMKYIMIGGPAMDITAEATGLVVLAAAAMGFGYAAWNVGLLRGNMIVLAGAANFIPVLSAAMAALVLDTTLSVPFWMGAAMVSAGSVLCWVAARRHAP